MTEYSKELRNSKNDQPEKKPKRINCLKCEHFKITWNDKQPRACKLFGFKGKEMPSVTVKRVTGRECPAFTPKKS